jgi:quinol monooxygenase YgiN
LARGFNLNGNVNRAFIEPVELADPDRSNGGLPMHRYLAATILAIVGSLCLGRAALAQDAPQPTYVIAYLEIAPGHAAEARQLILAYSADASQASGAVHVDALERIAYSSHFALIEQWQSPAAKQAYASTDAAVKFRAALGPLQSAAFDERIHSPLSVAPSSPSSVDPLVIVTHVDLIPTVVDVGVGKVKAFVEQGRNAAGNRRFDVLTQTSRKNHMTIVEHWDTQASKDAWISTTVARSFREELQPMSGSLYDERAYKPLQDHR